MEFASFDALALAFSRSSDPEAFLRRMRDKLVPSTYESLAAKLWQRRG